jgi:uncharacterized protein YfkK (UPF0435 family)
MTTVRYDPHWEKSKKIDDLICYINNSTEINSEGNIQFTNLEINQYFNILNDSFIHPKSLTKKEINNIIYRCALDLRKNGLINSNELLEKVNLRASQELSIPVKIFKMCTKLRLRPMNFQDQFTLKYNNVSIEGHCKLPDNMVVEEYFINGIGQIFPKNPPLFGYLILLANARNEESAADILFDTCDAFMAITNLLLRSHNIDGDGSSPEAALWYGPYQFFWQERQFLCSDHIWRNPNYRDDHWDQYPKRGTEFQKILPEIRSMLSILENHSLRSTISQVAKLVNEGMVSADLHYRTLRFWSALENLFSLSIEKNIPYEKIIKRSLFGVTEKNDRDLLAWKLNRLSNIRNKYVHVGDLETGHHDLNSFLKEFIVHHLFYLIKRGNDFKTHQEYIDMTDLPHDKAILEARRLAIKRRENVNSYGNHKGDGRI